MNCTPAYRLRGCFQVALGGRARPHGGAKNLLAEPARAAVHKQLQAIGIEVFR